MSRNLISLNRLRNVFTFAFLVLFAQWGQAADALSFFQNWFLPGDFVAVGIGLRSSGINGIAAGTFTMNGVPCVTAGGQIVPANQNGSCPQGSSPADAVAGFLYWVVEETGTNPSGNMDATFDGQAIVGKLLGDPGNPSCFSSGGTSGGPAAGRVYRAEVRNKLPLVNNVRVANGPHTITLPESGGNGNGQVRLTNGATFVAVYRIFAAGNPAIVPGLRAVIAYDGAYTLNKFSPPMTQPVLGFYQATADPAAKMIPIVSNGQPDFLASITVNNSAPLTPDPPSTGTSTNPFNGSAGPRWDNPTFNNIPVVGGAASYSTQVTTGNNQTCLTFAGLWTSINVEDPDGDSLVTKWETDGMHLNRHLNLNLLSSSTHRWDPRDPSQPATFGTCADYPSEPESCVNLPGMGGGGPHGTNPNRKDIFVEIDSLVASGHKHYVKYKAIEAVGTALRPNIELHVDVGDCLHSSSVSQCNSAYFDGAGNPKDFIVPKAYAQGGEEIDEDQSTLKCVGSGCAFPQFDNISVLSWKKGFDFVKNGLLRKQNGTVVYVIPTHFKTIRADMVRYGIMAHAFAAFKFNAGQPVPDTDANGKLLTYSGVADHPGSEFMVTLGLWRFDNAPSCDPYVDCNDRTGTWQVQAGTLMHEIGHLLGLSHAGKDPLPNFKPNYQSVMNYHYQTRLLTDSIGIGHVNYSNGGLNQLNKEQLSEASNALGPVTLPYRVRFWGPPISVNEPTPKNCASSQLGSLAVRVEAANVSTPDWNRNGIQDNFTTQFDVNCDLSQAGVLSDYNDFNALNFRQLSASFNLGGTSAQVGGFDAGGFDAGGFDAGGFDAGGFDAGGFDAGGFDAGGFDAGGFDAGGFDAGGFDAGGFDAGELDQTTNVSGGNDATPADQPLTATKMIDQIRLNWGVTPSAVIRRFNIYRKNSDSNSAIVLINHVDNPTATPSATFDDVVNNFTNSGAACPQTSTCYNTNYDYYITNVDFSLVLPTVTLTGWPNDPDGNGTSSGFSNKASGIVKHLFVTATATIFKNDPVPTSFPPTITGQDLAALPASSVTCTTTATGQSPVGTYPINCTGPLAVGTPPIDGITYVTGTLTIIKR
jgi:hypothetical protein